MAVRIHTLAKGSPEKEFNVECLYAAIPHDFNYVQAAPGFKKDPHPYGAGDSFMLVLTGSLDLTVDGETHSLKAGQMVIIPKGATRGFTAGPEGLTMIAAHLRDQ